MKEIMMDLSCSLDEAEVNERAQKLSSTVVRRDEVDLEKRNATKGYNERLAELEGSIRSLSKVIREKAEWRPVTCAVMFHQPIQGTKRVVRKDTGEIVRDEPMSSFEHQNNLFEEDTEQEQGTQSEAQAQFAASLDGIGLPTLADAVRRVEPSGKSERKGGKSSSKAPNGFDQ